MNIHEKARMARKLVEEILEECASDEFKDISENNDSIGELLTVFGEDITRKINLLEKWICNSNLKSL